MSLILDALNRSRNDAQQVPGLATFHHGDSGSRTGGWRSYLLPGALFVAVLLIVWLLWERSGDQPAAADIPQSGGAQSAAGVAPAAVTETRAASAAVTAPKPETAPLTANLPDSAANSSSELPGGRDVAPADPVAPAAPDSGSFGSDSVPASASVAALYRQQQRSRQKVPISSKAPEAARPGASGVADPAALGAGTVREQPIDIEEVLAMAEDELENARLAEHPAPFLSALSQQTKDTIPTLLYQAHDFTGKQSDSFVLINGKTLKQGGSVKGVRVDEILPDSVVLSFGGTQFRLRALNSWVNL